MNGNLAFPVLPAWLFRVCRERELKIVQHQNFYEVRGKNVDIAFANNASVALADLKPFARNGRQTNVIIFQRKQI